MQSLIPPAQHLHALKLCGAQSIAAELPVSLQEGLGQSQGLFLLVRMLCKMLPLLVLRESMGIALPWPGSPLQLGHLPCICFLREAVERPCAQGCLDEEDREMVAVPLLGFLWALLHDPFFQQRFLAATLGSLSSKEPWP